MCLSHLLCRSHRWGSEMERDNHMLHWWLALWDAKCGEKDHSEQNTLLVQD